MALPTKVGPTNLIYLFIKFPFEKPGSGFASEKVGPIMSIFPSYKSLCGKLTSDFETPRGEALSLFSADQPSDHFIEF